jgi:hypothetical protein
MKNDLDDQDKSRYARLVREVKMSVKAIVKDFAGKPAIFHSLENSEPPKVHFDSDDKMNFMSLEEWDSLLPWVGPMPFKAQSKN